MIVSISKSDTKLTQTIKVVFKDDTIHDVLHNLGFTYPEITELIALSNLLSNGNSDNRTMTIYNLRMLRLFEDRCPEYFI